MHPLLVSWNLELRSAPYNPGDHIIQDSDLAQDVYLPKSQFPGVTGRVIPPRAVQTASK